MLRSIDRLYSEGVMEKRFLNAALKVRIVEKPACPAISVMLRADCCQQPRPAMNILR